MSKHSINQATGTIEFPYQKIVERNMEKEVKQSFIEYSMSVITSRALPDVRDGTPQDYPTIKRGGSPA